jgi:hypothetical protein
MAQRQDNNNNDPDQYSKLWGQNNNCGPKKKILNNVSAVKNAGADAIIPICSTGYILSNWTVLSSTPNKNKSFKAKTGLYTVPATAIYSVQLVVSYELSGMLSDTALTDLVGFYLAINQTAGGVITQPLLAGQLLGLVRSTVGVEVYIGFGQTVVNGNLSLKEGDVLSVVYDATGLTPPITAPPGPACPDVPITINVAIPNPFTTSISTTLTIQQLANQNQNQWEND